ncbi:hypothetical protein CC86DRAFT_372447 [Ophiobolus disseminans]|uniref:Uncharacterized protein n=1 Tax=Ophiobolus disseminans TaxID=1469910 RepID=A0A6A6ZQX5_9PLEO|nr:hypothetical protein CC86DRAFT_372447 [Ophiobolus disseminans]
MAANAPYYQMRSGQFIAAPNSTNATPSRLGVEDNDYDLSAAAVASPHEHHPSTYLEHAPRQTSADTPMRSTEEDHNLAELLEAATTAAGQAAQAMDAHDVVAARTAAQGQGKRKRASSSSVADAVVTPQAGTAIAPKRQRVDVPTDPQLQTTEPEPRGDSGDNSVPPSSESLLNDARAAGVHSAAALFRRSTEKTSHKYTRPPMSKLFMSLQLSPENFLQLQAQAKAYMLDTSCPERQNCVGNRGKGDTDMVKLRLFNCVRDFLNDGVGDEFFGENVEKPGERDTFEAARALGEDKAPNTGGILTWPSDGNRIISLVTPLMRRMVTNERQRMYAIETRKGGAKRDKEGSVEAAAQQALRSPSGNDYRGQSIEQQLLPAFDPSLGRVAQTSQPASPSIPITTSPIAVADMGRFSRMVEDEPLVGTELLLPTDGPAESCIRNISIFVVLAPHTLPSGTVKAGVKLNEKRMYSQGPTHLTNLPWDILLTEVIQLLKRVKARYPAIRERLVPQEYRHTGASATIDTLNDRRNNLRELAAAANAYQGHNTTSKGEASVHEGIVQPTVTGPNAAERTSDETTQLACKKPATAPQAQLATLDLTDHDAALLPRYVIKTIGLNGWEFIENAEQWGDLLLRRGFDIWADGVINLIVELVEIPVSMERATGGKLVSVGGMRNKEKDTEKDTEKVTEKDMEKEETEAVSQDGTVSEDSDV